jgi:hypothetical protein
VAVEPERRVHAIPVILKHAVRFVAGVGIGSREAVAARDRRRAEGAGAAAHAQEPEEVAPPDGHG